MKKWEHTPYFPLSRNRPGRKCIKDEWILATANEPDRIEHQPNGRISHFKRIADFGGRWLRVILDDENTIHNAYFDRMIQ